MISRITGTLEVRELDHVEITTPGGVGYTLQVPLSVYESLPPRGADVTLHTSLVVKEDGWQLFGFASAYERRVFDLVRSASGVGPALALGLLSALSAERLVRAVIERDLATLQSAPRVGRKKAEQIVLDLASRMRDAIPESPPGVARPAGAAAEDAIRALVSLGYSTADAERGVRAALEAGPAPAGAPELIRTALAHIGGGGRRG